MQTDVCSISMAQVSSYKKLLQTAHNGSARRRDQDIQQFGAQLKILYVALLCQTAGTTKCIKTPLKCRTARIVTITPNIIVSSENLRQEIIMSHSH